MAIDLTKRDEKGSPITMEEHDDNLTDIETAINDLITRVEALEA